MNNSPTKTVAKKRNLTFYCPDDTKEGLKSLAQNSKITLEKYCITILTDAEKNKVLISTHANTALKKRNLGFNCPDDIKEGLKTLAKRSNVTLEKYCIYILADALKNKVLCRFTKVPKN